jgi:hypothetical protein
MKTAEQIGSELVSNVKQFSREVNEVYSRLVLPTWGTDLHGLPDALYGYMLGVFARIDLASAYWQGGDVGSQTARMVGFMEAFLGRPSDLCAVAVQIWRHKLIHTAQPRPLKHPTTGIVHRWLLHWGEHLLESQHFTLSESGEMAVLNLGLVYLIADLQRGLESFVGAAASDPTMQANMERFEHKLWNYTLSL